jgi:hypothetical protein
MLNAFESCEENNRTNTQQLFLWANFFVVDVVIMSTLKNEFKIFLCLRVQLIETTNPLGWWTTHLMQFPHVSFLACQVFDIITS